jgi:predicted phage tail protein
MGKDYAAIVIWPSAANARESITEYRVTSEPGGYVCVIAASKPNKECTVLNLTPGIAYSFIARAVNALGTSSPAISSTKFVPTAPGAPQSVRAEVAKGRGTVIWMPPNSNGYSVITRYVVVSNPGELTCESSGSLSCEVQGLSNGTAYTFRVTAFNSVGQSQASEPSIEVKLQAVPSAPSKVTVYRNGTSVTVKWMQPRSDGGSAIRNFVVTASPSSRGCRTRKQECTFAGLPAGESYVFTVQAQNRTGLGPSTSSNSILVPVPPKAELSVS